MVNLTELGERLFTDIAAEGLGKFLFGGGFVTLVLAAYDWFLGRSPLEIVGLVFLVLLVWAFFLWLLAKRASINRTSASLSAQDTGIEFFPTKTKLIQTRPLEDQLARASDRGIDAIFVYGQTVLNLHKNIGRINRLLLPNPYSPSFGHYEKTVNHQMTIAEHLEKAADKYRQNGVQVRFYPHFICYSLMIADPLKETGWVHVEMVMPFSLNSERPSIGVTRKISPEFVEHYAKVFEKMWGEASEIADDQTNDSHLDRSESLRIMKVLCDYHAFEKTNPRFLFHIFVYNGTTKEIRLAEADGSFFYKGVYPGQVECEIENQPIPSGETFCLNLFQWINKESADPILNHMGEKGQNHISFGFGKMRISMRCGKKILPIPLPDSIQFHMKEGWTVQPDDWMYRPT